MRASQAIERFLATLAEGSASTARQRRWALGKLLEWSASADGVVAWADPGHSPARGRPAEPSVRQLLAPQVVSAWMDAVASQASLSPVPVPSLRARAASVRALARYCVNQQLVGAHLLDELDDELRLPSPKPRPTQPELVRGLLVRLEGTAPPRVLPATWARTAAHLQLAVATGAPMADLAGLSAGAVSRTAHNVKVGDRSVRLPAPARRAVLAWLGRRAQLVAALEGGEPHQLWVRVAPASFPGGPLCPAGLAISERGLRMAFQAVRRELAREAPELLDVELRDLPAAALPEPPPAST